MKEFKRLVICERHGECDGGGCSGLHQFLHEPQCGCDSGCVYLGNDKECTCVFEEEEMK